MVREKRVSYICIIQSTCGLKVVRTTNHCVMYVFCKYMYILYYFSLYILGLTLGPHVDFVNTSIVLATFFAAIVNVNIINGI